MLFLGLCRRAHTIAVALWSMQVIAPSSAIWVRLLLTGASGKYYPKRLWRCIAQLGNIAHYTGQKLARDHVQRSVVSNAKANELVKAHYHNLWSRPAL